MSTRTSSGLIVAAAGAVALMVWLASTGGGDGAQFDPEDYPVGPITIVSWVPPGSPTDLLARAIAAVGPRHFGRGITVLNRQGGGGATAMGYLLRQPADGHTLAINTSSGTISMAGGHLPFTPDQFSFISRLQLDPYLVAVRADSPFQTLTGFFDFARANPGDLSVAGFGTASGHFLAFSMLKDAAGGPDIRWIAYEGSADANVAVLGGHASAVNTNYSVVREYLRAGTMRVLGVSAPVPTLPGVATYEEQGYAVAPIHWRGVMGHGGMSEELVARVNHLLEQTFRDPEFQDYMRTSGTLDGTMDSPEAFQAFVHAELASSRRLLQELGLLR